jgi:hypothetical protein
LPAAFARLAAFLKELAVQGSTTLLFFAADGRL